MSLKTSIFLMILFSATCIQASEKKALSQNRNPTSEGLYNCSNGQDADVIWQNMPILEGCPTLVSTVANKLFGETEAGRQIYSLSKSSLVEGKRRCLYYTLVKGTAMTNPSFTNKSLACESSF